MKKSILFALITTAFIIAVLIGCESSGPTAEQKVVGDVNDPTYQEVLAFSQVNSMMTGDMFDYLGFMVDTILLHPNNPNTAPKLKKENNRFALADSIIFTYHELSGYWYFYGSVSDTLYLDSGNFELLTLSIEDSIKFYHGEVGVQWPDSALLTKVHNGASFVLTFGSMGDIGANWNITVEGQNIFTVGDITLNGTNGAFVNLIDDVNNCTFVTNMTGSITNLAVNILIANACPTSGKITNTGNIAMACPGESYTDNWYIETTFQNDSIYVTIENSTTHWEHAESCGGPVVAPSLGKYSDLLR